MKATRRIERLEQARGAGDGIRYVVGASLPDDDDPNDDRAPVMTAEQWAARYVTPT
jgi:hypothetical protein